MHRLHNGMIQSNHFKTQITTKIMSKRMTREQLVARLNLVKRLMARANLHVLTKILVTDYSDKELCAQLSRFREAVHGENACGSRAAYEDRLVAALMKDCSGYRGMGYDHGVRFMSVEEELEELTDAGLRAELRRRGFKSIPRTKDGKYEALYELLETEHEADLEDSIDAIMTAELVKRGLPTTKKEISAWVQRNRVRVAESLKSVVMKSVVTGQLANPQKEESHPKKSKSGRKKRRRSNDDYDDETSTPQKKRRRNESSVLFLSSPSAVDDGRTDKGQRGRSSSETNSKSPEDVMKTDPLAFSSLLEKPNWRRITLRQMELELLLPHFDQEELSIDPSSSSEDYASSREDSKTSLISSCAVQ